MVISANKEKYLIEIYSNQDNEGYTRVSDLAKSLQVSVPSVSKMAKKLKDEELIEFQRYKMIKLTEKGEEVCKHLLENRHVLVQFLRYIGVDEDKVENEVKSIENTFSRDVIHLIDRFLKNT
ncbi:metal-dependent transcriptional regulator, partial [Lysinibacillus telephonicus]